MPVAVAVEDHQNAIDEEEMVITAAEEEFAAAAEEVAAEEEVVAAEEVAAAVGKEKLAKDVGNIREHEGTNKFIYFVLF